MVSPSSFPTVTCNPFPFLGVIHQEASFVCGVLGVVVSDDFRSGFKEFVKSSEGVGEEAGSRSRGFEQANVSGGKLGVPLIGIDFSVYVEG